MTINKWCLTENESNKAHYSILASVLNDRGYCDEMIQHKFLTPSLSDFYDPYALKGMTTAHDLIAEAIKSGDKITVYGDYDVDGMTSTAILMRLFKSLGAIAEYYIPSRFEEGYGVNRDAVKHIAKTGTKLLITVDCGITSIQEAELAKSLGMTIIITDHHHLAESVPNADAVINPKQLDCSYPYDMLAGAGIALKLAQTFISLDSELFKQLTILSAIGTVADIAPLIDENRLITQLGLQWSKDRLIGLNALMEVAAIANKPLTSGSIGFQIGPRLNAVGRLENAKLGVELLLSDNPVKAKEIATHLNLLNDMRKKEETKILEQALEQIKQNAQCTASGIIVVWGDNWNEGVIGIVASRLKERFYRPSIVLSNNGNVLKGSARSIEGFSIFNALTEVKHLMQKFGGHEQAAGLSMAYENLEAFINALGTYTKTHLTTAILTPKISLTHRVVSSDITHDTVKELENLAPFGVSNPRPIFLFDNLMVGQAAHIGKAKNVLKLKLNSDGKIFDAIKFNAYEKLPVIGTRLDAAFNLDVNRYKGIETIQFSLKDYRSYDPTHNDFTRVWYSVYLMHLFKFLETESTVKPSRNRYQRRYKDGKMILQDGRSILVSSFEGLLELAYHAFDLNIDLANLIDRGIINIVSAEGKDIDVVYDLPLNGSIDFALEYFRANDHAAILNALATTTVDRRQLAVIYKQIMRGEHIKQTQALLSASEPFVMMLALSFFEEAGFIQILDDDIKINTAVHHKTEFNFSNTHKTVEVLKQRLYTLFN